MADGTELHTFMFDHTVDPHTHQSCVWIRNKIARVLPDMKPKNINRIRMELGSKSLNADQLNLSVPRKENNGPFDYLPEAEISDVIISDTDADAEADTAEVAGLVANAQNPDAFVNKLLDRICNLEGVVSTLLEDQPKRSSNKR